MIRFWRWPAALVGGILLWLAYPPVNLGWLAIGGVALIVGSLYRAPLKQSFVIAFISSLTFYLLLLRWLTVIGSDGWILLSAVCSVYFGIMGIGIAFSTRFRWWPLLVAGMWISQEWIRGTWPFGGFPWGTLAFSQVDTSLGRTSTLLGMLGTSGVVVLCASLIVLVVVYTLEHRLTQAFPAIGVVAALVLAPLLISLPSTGDTQGGEPSATIAIVQGGTPAVGMNAFDVRRAVLDNHVRESMKLAVEINHDLVPKPAFVLWPENSSDLDPYRDQAAAAAIGVAVRALNVPVLIGAVVGNPQDSATVLNAGILWDPTSGPGQQYNKKHPVPFGEYVPFRSLLAPLINRFDRIGHDFAAGDATGIFHISNVDVGDVICFEIAYNSVVDALITDGARVLTVQTNNATYAGTAQPMQQFMIERMRALETGRSVVVAATTGISAFIGPDGQVLEEIPEGDVGSRVREAALRGSRNLGSYVGSYVTLIWGGLAVLVTGLATARAFRNRHRRARKVVQ